MKAKIEDKKEIAKNVLQIDLSLIDQPLLFKPGQYLSVTLPDMYYTDERGNIRYFSICTAPQLKGETWQFSIATRLSTSAYKRSLLRLLFGREVILGTVSGEMLLPDNFDQELVMIAGGMGITPFMSMLRWLNTQVQSQQWPQSVTLFYVNRSEELTPFLPELKTYARKIKNFNLHLAMTEQSDWAGYDRLVDHEMIRKQITDYKDAYYLVAGPTGMIMKIINNFDRLGISANHYKSEEFIGYNNE